MNRPGLMLADLEVSDIMEAQKHYSDSPLYYMLIILGAITVAAILACIWAIFYSLKRKKRKHHKHRHHHRQPLPIAPTATGNGAKLPPAEDRSQKKRRKQRRPHRPMNPTLAQTRGLPPLRDEITPLPPMP